MVLKARRAAKPKDPSGLTCGWRGCFPLEPSMRRMEAVTTEGGLARLEEGLLSVPAFAFDTETNTLRVASDTEEFRLVGVSFSWGEDDSYYIPVGHLREEDAGRQLPLGDVVGFLGRVFAREDVRVYGWNLKFDLHVLKRVGVEVRSEDLFDGMLASWLCDENTPNGLKENSLARLGVEQEHFGDATATVPPEARKSLGYKANSKVPFSLVLIDDAVPYACGDAFYTWCCCLGYEGELVKEGMDRIFWAVYMPFMRVLLDMEEHGVTVDAPKLEEMGREMEGDMESLQYKIYELAGVEFNLGSSQQKAELLFGYEKPGTPVKRDDPPKAVSDIVGAFREGGMSESECRERLSEKGYYADERGMVFKRANTNPEILRKSFGFPVMGQTKGGMPSTDADTIWRLSRREYKDERKRQGAKMCGLLSEYSKVAKLKTAFVDGLLEQLYPDGRAHPTFNQIGTDSGRLSCQNPNLQQLPKADEGDEYKIRGVFVGSEYVADAWSGEYVADLKDYGKPLDGSVYVDRKHIIALDYHNLEMVCLTHFSGDQRLSEMFANDDDAHGSTAVNMFGLDCSPVECKKKYPHLRQAAKVINFLLMYGGGAGRLYETLKGDRLSPVDLGGREYLEEYGCSSGKEVAQKFIDRYFETYGGVAKFIRSQKRFAHENGYVYTIIGRKRRLPGINSPDGAESSYCERLAVNSAIQGTAGDITISAQLRVSKERRLRELGCVMLIQVHDELVFECPEQSVDEAIGIIKRDMESPFGDGGGRRVKYLRADADSGPSYQDAK